ncbi:hypothetical protein [Halarchaeum acidiphilum]|nr:hypothetical protein [Halarchaeum acidiphilum]
MTANRDATITDVNVTVANATYLWDQNGGQPEIIIGDGYYDANRADSPNSDNKYYRLGNTVSMTSNATLTEGSETTIRMQQFWSEAAEAGGNETAPTVDVQNKRVTMTSSKTSALR